MSTAEILPIAKTTNPRGERFGRIAKGLTTPQTRMAKGCERIERILTKISFYFLVMLTFFSQSQEKNILHSKKLEYFRVYTFDSFAIRVLSSLYPFAKVSQSNKSFRRMGGF